MPEWRPTELYSCIADFLTYLPICYPVIEFDFNLLPMSANCWWIFKNLHVVILPDMSDWESSCEADGSEGVHPSEEESQQ